MNVAKEKRLLDFHGVKVDVARYAFLYFPDGSKCSIQVSLGQDGAVLCSSVPDCDENGNLLFDEATAFASRTYDKDKVTPEDKALWNAAVDLLRKDWREIQK